MIWLVCLLVMVFCAGVLLGAGVTLHLWQRSVRRSREFLRLPPGITILNPHILAGEDSRQHGFKSNEEFEVKKPWRPEMGFE